MLFFALIIGIALGAAFAWLAVRSQTSLVAARSQAEISRLETSLEHERRASAEKLQLLENAQGQLSTSFKALCADALRNNNTSFLELARSELEQVRITARGELEQKQKAVEHLVQPIRESLEKFDGQIRSLEQVRSEAYGSLTAQVRSLAEGQKELRTETHSLVTALRSPIARGRWGEIQLKRVVEMAGMLSHCDFVEQSTVMADGRALRPDLIVKLPGGKNVVVDAKAPLQAYLDSLEAKDEATRQACLADHARQTRDHIARLSAKSYWGQFDSTPEFVVMFMPGEPFFSAALEQNPSLIEEGVNQQVILATPTTLIAVLRAVAYGWRQETIAESARTISALGCELHKRLSTMSEHFLRLGRRLDGAVEAYNETVGSLERRVLVTARRFPEHGAGSGGELDQLTPIDRSAQVLQAPELLAGPADVPPELPAKNAA